MEPTLSLQAPNGALKHLFDTRDLSRDHAELILAQAAQMADAITGREVPKLPALRGRTVVNLFFEDSTRTRTSFETAAKRLSADVVNFAAKTSSLNKGESLKDTALTLHAMGADAVVVRHQSSGVPERLSQWLPASILNAGDGMRAHPTQALLDAYTIKQRLGSIEGRTVTIVGDILHSRVARSNAWLLSTLGAHVRFVAPPTLLPPHDDIWPVEIEHNLDAALADTDAIMMLRVQRERMNSAFFPNTHEYAALYGLDERRVAKLPPHAIIMHPGPMNRGLEIASTVADSPRTTIVDQVTNGVWVRMAVLYLLLTNGAA